MKVTWAQAFRDIFVASINKGQFPLALFGLVLIIMVARMPEADVGFLMTRLMDGLENFWLAGYLLFVVTLGGWYVHAQHQRRVMAREIHRLSVERTRLQESLGAGVQSSGRR